MEAGAARKARVKFPDLQARPETRLLNTVVLINDAFEGVRRIMLLDAEHNRQLAFSCPEDVAKIRGQVTLSNWSERWLHWYCSSVCRYHERRPTRKAERRAEVPSARLVQGELPGTCGRCRRGG